MLQLLMNEHAKIAWNIATKRYIILSKILRKLYIWKIMMLAIQKKWLKIFHFSYFLAKCSWKPIKIVVLKSIKHLII